MKHCNFWIWSNCLWLLGALLFPGCGDDQSGWRVLGETGYGRHPVWSPDGRQILFGDDTESHAALMLWTPSSNNIALLSNGLTHHNWDYVWSPDGSQIAFTSPGADDSSSAGVWVVDPAAEQVIRIMDRGRDVSWYYTGTKLAVRLDRPAAGTPGIYLLDNDGTGVRFITAGFKPICSPQDGSIIFLNGETAGSLNQWSPDNSVVTLSGIGATQAGWSADGGSVCWIENRYTEGDLPGELWLDEIPGPPWLITYNATTPALNATGERLAFARITMVELDGLWLYTLRAGTENITNSGNWPAFDPTNSNRLAITMPGGGIRLLERQ